MINPLHFRPPEQEDVDHDGHVVDDWEDNWLSNSLAWASQTFLKNWCQTPEHWTSRFANYLYTSCPCCMVFRGLTLGFLFSVVLWIPILIIVATR